MRRSRFRRFDAASSGDARVYDPRIGSFTGTDPLGGDGGGSWNPYAYAGGNPLNAVDPSGMDDQPYQFEL